MRDYEDVRSNLLAMLEELDDRLGKITEDIKHSEEPLAKDFAEQVTETENDEVLDTLGNMAKDEIRLVKQAINRIDRGEYGICVVCGEPIRQERLKALPYSNTCIKCAELQASND